MSNRTRFRESGQQKLLAPREELTRQIREELRERMSVSVLGVVEQLFEEEVRQLCGEPWSRKAADVPRRGGSERGSIYLEGQRVPVRYPRVRESGQSRRSEMYGRLRDVDLLSEEVQGKLLRGVSTRDYRDVVNAIADGTSLPRSTVSAAFIRASLKSLEELNGRDLSGELMMVLMVDALQIGDAALVVAMGISAEGRKVLLGLREGHTENSTVVGELLENLIERKLALSERFLAVIDGSKALRRALVDRWQGRVIIQRCQVHKKRNVLEQLPETYQDETRRRMNAAYHLRDFGQARKLLAHTVKWLEEISEPAARSLEEGLEETLTVVRLDLPDLLRRTLSTTNPLESVLDGVRYRTARVKRWRRGKGQMAARWTASALLLIEKRLNRIKGYRLMPMLVESLKPKSVDAMLKVG